MDFLVSYFSNEYYIELLNAIIAFIAICLPIKTTNQFLIYFKIYFAVYLLLLATTCYSHYHYFAFKKFYKPLVYFQNGFDFLFTILEFLVFYRALSFYVHRWVRLTILSSFLALGIVLWAKSMIEVGFVTEDYLFMFFTLQSISLLPICVGYFYTIFKFNQGLELSREPTFWLATGLTFFSLCTLPFSLVSRYLLITDAALLVQLFPIFHVFYVLLFLMTLKAFLCPRATHSS